MRDVTTFSSSNSIKENASDYTGSAKSVGSNLSFALLTIIIFILFAILIFYSFVHKKVRIKKQNKKIKKL